MKSFSSVAVPLVALASLSSMALAVKIDTPLSVVECQPQALTWHDAATTGPIYISAVPGSDISGTPLVRFAPQAPAAEGSLTWPQVNVTAGTQFTLVINDGTGQPNFSSLVTVQKGNSDCGSVAGGSGGTASSGAAAAAPAAGAGSTTASSGTGASSGSSASSSASGTSSSSGNSTKSSSSPSSSSSKPATSSNSSGSSSSSMSGGALADARTNVGTPLLIAGMTLIGALVAGLV